MDRTNEINFKLPKQVMTKGILECIICVLAFLLYANTLGHDFTQDDAIVIYDNIYVQEGIGGLKDIFTKDSFSGFFKGEDKSSIVSGGRYRPLTIAIFSGVYELVGAKPFYYHLLVTVLFSLLSLLLFRIITLVKTPWSPEKQRLFAFIATLLFVGHPIHTEAVANVKGLDEVFSLLFSLIATLYAYRFIVSKKTKYLPLLAISFFLALLSKENAVAFLLIIPVILFYFDSDVGSQKTKSLFYSTSVMAISFITYWILRTNIVGADFGSTPSEMMNNPFIKIEGGRYVPFTSAERWASIFLGMGKYIQLLIFPHPLTHDYYPRHFGVVSFKDISVISSVVMNLALGLIALFGIRKKSFVSFCIFLFYVTIGLMSNVIFPIGTHLSERFLFTPSLAICLLLAFLFIQLFAIDKFRKSSFYVLAALVIAGSIKTISRNAVWKNDLTLFTTDVRVSKNSAKVRNASGGALLAASLKEEDGTLKQDMIKESILHLTEAVRIHPNYKEEYLLTGNAYSYLREYENSIKAYNQALKINPYYDQASQNLLIVLREGAREAGSQKGDVRLAIQYLEQALLINPNDFESTALMGTAYGSSGDHTKAIAFYKKAILLKPEIATTYVNLGLAQLNGGMEDEAQLNFNRALQIDPKSLDNIRKVN